MVRYRFSMSAIIPRVRLEGNDPKDTTEETLVHGRSMVSEYVKHQSRNYDKKSTETNECKAIDIDRIQ